MYLYPKSSLFIDERTNRPFHSANVGRTDTNETGREGQLTAAPRSTSEVFPADARHPVTLHPTQHSAANQWCTEEPTLLAAMRNWKRRVCSTRPSTVEHGTRCFGTTRLLAPRASHESSPEPEHPCLTEVAEALRHPLSRAQAQRRSKLQ